MPYGSKGLLSCDGVVLYGPPEDNTGVIPDGMKRGFRGEDHCGVKSRGEES